MKVFPLNNWGGAKRHRSRSSRGLSVRLLPNASTQPPEGFAISGDWKFSRWKCSGTRPLLRLESPGRAPEGSPGKRGAGAPGPLSPLAAPWVSVPTDFLLSPRIAHHWAIRGERLGEGGGRLPIPESCVSLFSKSFSARSMICASRHGLAPSPWPSPPTQKTCWGRGNKWWDW